MSTTLVAIALALHALAAVVWVGGMAFAYAFLRPVAASALDRAARLDLWHGVFARFFPVVWAAALLLLATGYLLVFTAFGGFANVGIHVHVMHGLALVMVALFAHVYFAPWRRFRQALDGANHDLAVEALDRIRRFIALNLTLGLLVVVVGASGRYWG
jgi:uncharacterized membrane protein